MVCACVLYVMSGLSIHGSQGGGASLVVDNQLQGREFALSKSKSKTND